MRCDIYESQPSLGATMTNFIQKFFQEVEAFFEGTVLPDAKKAELVVEKLAYNWMSQFETDFGKTALNLAVSFVNSLTIGTPLPTVIALGATVAEELEKAAITTAEQDAQSVILNAARTALTPPANAVPNVQAAPVVAPPASSAAPAIPSNGANNATASA